MEDKTKTSNKETTNTKETKSTKSEVQASEFDVRGVERRGDKIALQVSGEVVISPTDEERNKYLNTPVGSRIKLDVKGIK